LFDEVVAKAVGCSFCRSQKERVGGDNPCKKKSLLADFPDRVRVRRWVEVEDEGWQRM